MHRAGDRRFWTIALAMLGGNAIIGHFRLPWLARFFAPASMSGWQADFAYLDRTNGVVMSRHIPCCTWPPDQAGLCSGGTALRMGSDLAPSGNSTKAVRRSHPCHRTPGRKAFNIVGPRDSALGRPWVNPWRSLPCSVEEWGHPGGRSGAGRRA